MARKPEAAKTPKAEPPHDKPLGERRERILRAIVEAYIEAGEAVGSRAVADEAGLGVSSATIRNEMGILEREGYITQPHTSAGRVPTDKAYRYYVDVLAPKRALDPRRLHEIDKSLSGTLSAMDELLQRASELLSELTDYTALASAPPFGEAPCRWIDLVPLGGRRVFLILISEGARHEEWLLELPSDASEDLVKRSAERISRIVNGVGPSEAAEKLAQNADGEHAEIMRTVAKALRGSARRGARLFTGGAFHSLEWGSGPAVRRILESIEGGSFGAMMADSDTEGVAVRIGSELPMSDLHSLSLIVAGYELGRQGAGTPGALGVLGPTRMDYPAVISAVAAVARSVSRALRRLEQS